MPPDNQISVTVLVSGSPVAVDVNPHQKLEVLVREALRKSGNQGQPPDQWELRREDGEVLNQEDRIQDIGLEEGSMLTLQPVVAAGG